MAPVLKGKEKAMVFLSTLGDEVSKKVLSCLPDKLSSKIAAELNNFPKPTPEAIALVFKELNRIALTRTESLRISAPAAAETEINSPFGNKSSRELLTILQDEQPQTIAFVISYLSQSMRNNFYDILSPGRRSEIKQLAVEKVPMSEVLFGSISKYLQAKQA